MVTLERRWDRRVEGWHSHVTSSAAFDQVLDGLIRVSCPKPTDACVDLGAGTGFVTTALAPLVSSVLAVDISPAMAASLAERAARDGLRNVSTEVSDLRAFQLPPASVDLVVSSYALHHLLDADKRALVARAVRWLRPGGRLVIADMMFGRGASRRDRDILRQKVTALAAKGPGGWWRIAKNLTRYGLGFGQEHPATPEFWQTALRDAEFSEVLFQSVVAEAGIVHGIRPAAKLTDRAPPSGRIVILFPSERTAVFHNEAGNLAAFADNNEAITLSRTAGDNYRLATTLANLAFDQHATGKLRAARAHLQEASRLADNLGYQNLSVGLRQNLGLVELIDGNPCSARGHFLASLDAARITGVTSYVHGVLLGLALAVGADGDPTVAATLH
ncbi:MAG: class I SAM-dependent methyltransferase, partial [Sciscionella sp.]